MRMGLRPELHQERVSATHTARLEGDRVRLTVEIVGPVSELRAHLWGIADEVAADASEVYRWRIDSRTQRDPKLVASLGGVRVDASGRGVSGRPAEGAVVRSRAAGPLHIMGGRGYTLCGVRPLDHLPSYLHLPEHGRVCRTCERSAERYPPPSPGPLEPVEPDARTLAAAARLGIAPEDL